ncbi:alpha/beta fold hydrolase [Miltoncostaea marina]|uniref:alpha/beta fold hydrolase n=1 Tax=Miltoncostaea marina TaxID=2843215 RepID=UPI001C3E1475|nr:alpha/beta fold hydrolase [Miltoncostaea marina]
MPAPFTALHRGGAGPPLVCLHGFTDTWRTWELALPHLERRHEVLAPTLPGHAGGPPLDAEPGHDALLDAVERAMDAAGMATAHVAGNSLGGYLALRLAARGRARTVVAFAPAGGWEPADAAFTRMLQGFVARQREVRAMAPQADALVATPAGRRRATSLITERSDHIPAGLIVHQLLGVAACRDVGPMVEAALRDGYPLDAAAVDCPVRVVWGTRDRLLPLPAAAARLRHRLLPHADWVELDDVGHCPQLDVPLEAAELILGLTGA